MRSPTLLMAAVRARPGSEEESEPVIVRPNGSTTVIELEDGRRYFFDAVELQQAIESPDALQVGALRRGSLASTTTPKELPNGGG